jgi:hypothetical protein
MTINRIACIALGVIGAHRPVVVISMMTPYTVLAVPKSIYRTEILVIRSKNTEVEMSP